ncbi:MAG: aminotransferase class III-fold pyridoxal phosphate-dependent enzyme [Gemmataceae bacterium]|nr:aminotransferase class III-fold pyridoxal phosphate-dependent enzyme [Gemmataceae bacterium]MCI0738029.1 aminotransferase class III-fold pyridoxal phosphate-dependent enzyme [Gemmataceae bacterium]
MSDLIVLGTDTDAGKTTFALLWLAFFADRFDYWKPVESGASDTETVRALLPDASVFAPACRFSQPLAPPLAARAQGATVPSAAELAKRRPRPATGRLLIETFGSPYSPLNETDLQVALLHLLVGRRVLVSSSALGAIGRTLQCLTALESEALRPDAVVLLGARDEFSTPARRASEGFAAEKIRQFGSAIPVFLLQSPKEWTCQGIQAAAAGQSDVLNELLTLFSDQSAAPTSQEILLASDDQHVWHPYTSLRGGEPPLVCVGADKEYLQLADGRRIIDGISSWWTILHGHRHPPLMQALRETAAIYDHVHFAGVTHEPAIRLAEAMLATTPWGTPSPPTPLPQGEGRQVTRPSRDREGAGGLWGDVPGKQECSPHDAGRVFFSDNGSTAVEVALKMAYQYWCHLDEPQRTRFIGFEHGYHGDTFGAMAISRDPVFFGRFEPLLLQAGIVPLDPDRLDEELQKHRGQVAAVIVEPLVQGAGGMRLHTPQTLRALYEVTRRHDVLFIADEVLTGLRFGSPWLSLDHGVTPDLICAAKTLAGGVLPLAATLASPRIVAAFESDDRRRTFFHGHSFTAHPLACAVALVNWQNLPSREAKLRMEALWCQQLEPLRDRGTVNTSLTRERRTINDVRIFGPMAAIESNAAGGYLADVAKELRRRCLEKGVLLRPLGNVLYALPPLETSAESLQQIADAVRDVAV